MSSVPPAVPASRSPRSWWGGDPYSYAVTPAGNVTCTANLDEDPALDVWSTSPGGGAPHHDVEDLDGDPEHPREGR